MADVILEAWAYNAVEETCAVVVPDGCRDLIWRSDPGCRPRWFVSSLDCSARQVACQRGTRFIGYRLRPGTQIDGTGLHDLLSGRRAEREPDPLSVAEFVHIDPRVDEALGALAAGGTKAAARGLGMSERSLQRLVRAGTGKTPRFWTGLARVRRAAREASRVGPLAEIAWRCGYADQAHMTRDFRRWLGVPPRLFRRRPDLIAAVGERAYG